MFYTLIREKSFKIISARKTSETFFFINFNRMSVKKTADINAYNREYYHTHPEYRIAKKESALKFRLNNPNYFRSSRIKDYIKEYKKSYYEKKPLVYCDNCPYSTKRTTDLKRHKRTMHSENESEESDTTTSSTSS
jgi:hypothetical protein